jgi:hypothetical protein
MYIRTKIRVEKKILKDVKTIDKWTTFSTSKLIVFATTKKESSLIPIPEGKIWNNPLR